MKKQAVVTRGRGRRRQGVQKLEDIPNIGPSLAADLRQVGILRPAELAGRDPYRLYDNLCRVTGSRQDPCVLDTFMSAVRYMEGAPARPWWHYTPERKRRWPTLGAGH